MGKVLTHEEEGLADLCGLKPHERPYEVVESTQFPDVYVELAKRKLKPYFFMPGPLKIGRNAEIEAHFRLLRAEKGDIADYVACITTERRRNTDHSAWQILYKLFAPVDLENSPGSRIAWPKSTMYPRMENDEIEQCCGMPRGNYSVEYMGFSFDEVFKQLRPAGYKMDSLRETRRQYTRSNSPRGVRIARTLSLHLYYPHFRVRDEKEIIRGMITSEGIDIPAYRLYVRI